MTPSSFPAPEITLTRSEARHFLLAHQKLYPPRTIQSVKDLFSFFDRVGCIQFDPINMLGQNANLVLQARYRGYRPDLLGKLLYQDRSLWDGFDKVASIYRTTDRPYFERRRKAIREQFESADEPPMKVSVEVLEEIRTRGPLSSIDFKDDQKYDWTWGQPVRLARAALEILFAMGDIGIHHRVGSRRVFDLVENLVPEKILATSDPNPEDEQYQEWHMLRRIGGFGLTHAGAGDHWLGMPGIKSPERRAALARLVDQGRAISVRVQGVENETFFIRNEDRGALDSTTPHSPEAAFIAPLDNVAWNRRVLRWLFDFDYTWEVYKPAAQRQYGYYVLPVLFGDRFVARIEPRLDKGKPVLSVNNWWWEKNISPNEEMRQALINCTLAFAQYLGAEEIEIDASLRRKRSLGWLKEAKNRLSER